MIEPKRSRWWRHVSLIIAGMMLGAVMISPSFANHTPQHTKQQIKKLNQRITKVDRKVQVMSKFRRVAATSGATAAAARSAAPKITLFRKGPLTVYAKCFRDNGLSEVHGETFIATTVAGAIFEGDNGQKEGGPSASDFLNPNTPEVERIMDNESTNGTNFDPNEDSDFHAMAPGGARIDGEIAIAVKQGNLAGGNGVYGAGNVCLFSGFAM